MKAKRGLMEVADRGTLFLDEIGELPLTLQAKLLRVLQERQLRHVGGTAQIDVDVRVVSATNRDLREAAAKGQFREELYYRVNVIAIALPPLRERAGDLKLLAHAFLKRYGGERVTGFDDAALQTLEAYAWPGNVRELQNVIERACALADGDRVTRSDLPDHLMQSGGTRSPAAGMPTVPALPNDDLPLKDAKEKWMQVLEVILLARPARASRRQRICGRQGRGHRPQDVPPADQQVPDSRLIAAAAGQRCPTEALGPQTSLRRVRLNTPIPFTSCPGTGVAHVMGVTRSRQ